MSGPDGRLSLAAVVNIIIVFILQVFEDLLNAVHQHVLHALHQLGHARYTDEEVHLSRSRMVPQQCTDTDETTPLLDRLMWQEYEDLLRRTHSQMQSPWRSLQQQHGCTPRSRHQLASAQDMATQTAPDQFGTIAEEVPAVQTTCPKAVSSQTPAATAATSATAASGITERSDEQAPQTMAQDSGYSSGMLSREGDHSGEPLQRRPGDRIDAVTKNRADNSPAHNNDGGTATHSSDEDGADDKHEEHG